MNITVVVPTIRPEQLATFINAWREQFTQYQARLVVVFDGEKPTLNVYDFSLGRPFQECSDLNLDFLGNQRGLVSNFTPAVRNAGFAFVAHYLSCTDVIFTTDDDTGPDGDTLGDHLAILGQRVPISWLPTFTAYTGNTRVWPRGFPANVREEAPVVISHGVWSNHIDVDAMTQWVLGTQFQAEFYKGPVPRGIMLPFCGMNVAFLRQALPLMYWAPVNLPGLQRFDDIFLGVSLAHRLSEMNLAMVTGYATVQHNRLSSVFNNLDREVLGVRWLEEFWQKNPSSYWELRQFEAEYAQKREAWERWIGECVALSPS